MKKHLLSMALGLFVGTSAFAQVEFVDDVTKEIIPNGSTIVRNVIDTPFELPGVGKNQQISSGLSAKNTSSATVSVKSQLNVTDIPFGQLALCFPGDCWVNVGNYKGTYPTHKPVQNNLSADGPWTSPNAGSLGAGASKSLESEWVISNMGNCTWDGSIGSFTATYTLIADGKECSTVKVLYTTDPNATGISGIKSDTANKAVIGTYNAAGQQVAPGTKGLNIVKYSDGSSKKVVIK